MLNFVNILESNAFQDREGITSAKFGPQLSMPDYPLDFQYESDEAVSSFVAINKISGESTSLSTALIDTSNDYHFCNGLTAYASALDCGLYYFLINSKYQSDDFYVVPTLEIVAAGTEISVNGLYFFDINHDSPEQDKNGNPFITFGNELFSNKYPAKFRYVSDEAVSSFNMISVDILGRDCETITIDTGLIDTSGNYHTCTGEDQFTTYPPKGLYYFLVNNKYKSKLFGIFEEIPEGVDCLELYPDDILELYGGGCLELY